GHDSSSAAVNDIGLCHLDAFGRNLFDNAAFDDQFMAAAQFAGIWIEHFEILEMIGAHGSVHDPAVAWIEMSYAGLPASMGNGRTSASHSNTIRGEAPVKPRESSQLSGAERT